MTVKAYIDGPSDAKFGAYFLITEDGRVLNSHTCSNLGYAKSDLLKYMPEENRGAYEILLVGEDEMTNEELFRGVKERAEARRVEDGGMA